MFITVPLKARQWTLLEPVQSGPNPHALLAYLIISYNLPLGLTEGLFPFHVTKTLYTFFTCTMGAARPAQLNLLNVVALIIQGDSYTTKLEYSVIENEQRQWLPSKYL